MNTPVDLPSNIPDLLALITSATKALERLCAQNTNEGEATHLPPHVTSNDHAAPVELPPPLTTPATVEAPANARARAEGPNRRTERLLNVANDKQTSMANGAICPPLSEETRSVLPTRDAAFHLNRAEQTMRAWASQGGAIQPIRVNGRLMWRVKDIRDVLGESS